ncbi:MAG: hypothetical protein IJ371_00360 [Clostridia bacterium]|nr:hypothetical protein [Clostridia bacterium]
MKKDKVIILTKNYITTRVEEILTKQEELFKKGGTEEDLAFLAGYNIALRDIYKFIEYVDKGSY